MTSLCNHINTRNQNTHFTPLHRQPQNIMNINPHAHLRSPFGPLTDNHTQNHPSTQKPRRNPKGDNLRPSTRAKSNISTETKKALLNPKAPGSIPS